MKPVSISKNTFRGSLTAFCFGLLLVAVQAKGQVYTANKVPFNEGVLYTDVTTGATQLSSPSPQGIVGNAAGLCIAGKYLYVVNAYLQNDMQRWDRATDTWTTLAPWPSNGSNFASYPVFDGNHTIYTIDAGGGGACLKYDIPTNTWTTFTNLPHPVQPDFYHGLVYQASTSSLFTLFSNGTLYKYSIPTDTWSVEATYPPFDEDAFNNVKCYVAFIGPDRYVLGKELASGQVKFYKNSTPLAPPPFAFTEFFEMYSYKGKLYAVIDKYLYEYDPGSTTWTKKNNIPDYNNLGMCTDDVTPTVNLSLAVLPTTQTANKGETISYTYTLTSAGDADGVIVKVRPPKGLTLLSNTPQQGTYNPTTQFWNVGTVTAGTRTLVLTLKVD